MAKFTRSLEGRVRQGEILSDVNQLVSVPAHGGTVQVRFTGHPYCLVLSQDCDLEQDHDIRQSGKLGAVPNLLLCMADTLDVMRSMSPGSDVFKRVIQNKDERYHCLEVVPPECDLQGTGLPCLGVDFRRFFTVETEDLYSQIRLGSAKRRCVLSVPYAEQLSARFCNYLCRIALPADFEIPMPGKPT